MSARTQRLAAFVLPAALAIAGSACQPLIQTPPQFLELQPAGRDFDYRATSADGVVLAARVLDFEEERGGGLAFWVQAVKLQLARTGEYASLGERKVTTRDGVHGMQLRFGRDERKTPYQYWITVLIASDKLVVIEAGGPEAKLTRYEPRITAAIESLSL